MVGMQRLSTPTRTEVDLAHAKRNWLDIGVPSPKNLGYIQRSRAALWLVLAVSSLPLHLFYNSAVFTQVSASQYRVFVVDPSFTAGAPFDVKSVTTAYGLDLASTERPDLALKDLSFLQQHLSSLVPLSRVECINIYGQGVQTTRGDVLVLAEESNATSTNSLLGVTHYGNGGIMYVTHFPES